MEDKLANFEIERYSRQLILPEFGVSSQLKLKSKSALIIGCGGLGCPAALYLATSGVGKLGFIDHDVIEISNIHRQIAHDETKVGRSKSENLAEQCKLLNSLTEYIVYNYALEKSNAMNIIEKYDVILDCSDNIITRYLINDCCVILNKPLISGGALRFDGQLTVYNYKDGPCLRCIYPTAQSRETVNNCSDVGILGPVVGTIGTLQALEAIKVLTDIGDCLSGRLLFFNALDFQMKVFNLRKNNKNCVLCNKQITSIDSFDYVQFCGGSNYNDKTLNINLLELSDRITCEKYKEILNDNNNNSQPKYILLDVRPKNEFEMCSLPNSLNINIEEFKNDDTLQLIKKEINKKCAESVFIICRRGNDSQIAVNILKNYLKENFEVKDIIGGLVAWHHQVDKSFPKY